MSRPTPTAVLQQRSSFKKHPERKRPHEPQAFGQPQKPQHVASDAVASDAWDRVSGLLSEMGVLSRSDEMCLEQLAIAYSAWRRALDRIRGGDETEEGRTYSSASIREAKEASDKIVKLLTECGLTPAARTKVQVVTEKAEFDWFEQALRNRASN